MEARIAEYATAPTPPSPPPSPLSLWSSLLPQIPSPPLHVSSPPLPLPPPTVDNPTYAEAPLGYREAEIRLRATSPSTHHLLHPSSPHLPPPVPTSLPLPSLPLPPLPALLFIQPPRYEVWESSTAAPRPSGGQRADYGFIDTINAKIRCQRAEEGQLSAALGQIQALQARDQTHADDLEGAGSSALNNMPPKRTFAATTRVAAAAAVSPMTVAIVKQLIKARVSVTLANNETLRNSTNGHGNESHNSDTRIRGIVCTPLFHISNYAVENQVKFATCTFLGNALT
ncbi:hypothetical protein Tco_0503729 [Tanacetum coccineum]